MRSKKALLVVDVQNDFCPGGALPVPDGDKIIPVMNKYITYFSRKGLPIFFSRDWHPERTGHFKKFGGEWPDHCVQRTKGAEFHPKLKLPKDAIVVSKGMDPKKDSYSAFLAHDKDGVEFIKILRSLGIEELYIGGLATDYCVKRSTLDALKKGFKVKLLVDAIRGVEVEPGDSEKAVKKMLERGAKKMTFSKLRPGKRK